MRIGALVVVMIVVTLGSAFAASDPLDFVVIVHPENPDTSQEKSRLDGIFLGKIKEFSDGTEIQPLQNSDAELSESFSQAVHHRSYEAVKAYWAAVGFRKFVTPPPKLEDAAVVNFVRENRGAIGYVSRGAALDGVTTVSLVE